MSDKSNWQNQEQSGARDAVTSEVNPDADVWLPDDEHDEHSDD
jgi:hypothetical protein